VRHVERHVDPPARAVDHGRAMGAHESAGDGLREPDAAPRLVVHVVDSFAAIGGGDGLLNLIRHLPAERYRHAIVCLQGDDGDSAAATGNVSVIPLAASDAGRLKAAAAGTRLPLYLRLFRVLRTLRPDLIHTRNGAGLWAQPVAALAGVRVRVHAELGRDGRDGQNGRGGGLAARTARRLLTPLVDHFIAASTDLERWLIDSAGAAPARVSHIANGIDSVQFHPRLGPVAALGPRGFLHDGAFVIGSAGRIDEAGGHTMLVETFLRLIASPHPAHARLRLLIVGDGPARAECQAMLQRAGAADRAWLPGAHPDLPGLPQLLRAMDVFVMPSPGDDRAQAILQAMATGLPVVAAGAGGNAELVHPGFTGILVPPLSVEMLASAIADYCRIPDMAIRHGARARSQVIARHSMPAMARDVLAIYDALTDRSDI
jgi:sugar transferase (PEP-CTERM/EpsH1 system associated)